MKDRLKYVIDSRYFDGTCLTSMSDGFRNDYGGETIEELRIRENNPFLITVTQSRINKMLRIFYNSLEAPFREITEEDYFYLMDVLPPLYLKEDSFFVGEPHYVNIYPFCFERNGHYFQGLRSIKTPPNELDRQIDQYMKIMNRKATVIKTNPHQPESRDLKRGNKQNNQRNQTHSLLFFTGRKTARIHLQSCHPIRFQTSKDRHGEYPEESSQEPLSVL